MAESRSRSRVVAGRLPPRYRDPELLAEGGMGELYWAIDAALERPVAIKLLAPVVADDPDLRERFTREAMAAARLSGGPNIVTVFDVGRCQGRPFIVMEYLAGGSLEQRLRQEGPPPPGRALVWLGEAASALDHAHARGVVHRDVKPANLLFDQQGVLKVADFGIASASGLASLTESGTVLGTAGYLAPEQAAGERVTAAADRYALAVVAFELLTGGRPFSSDSPTAEAAAHVAVPTPSASERNPELPGDLDAVFRRALAKNPQERFASCGEVVEAIGVVFGRATAQSRSSETAATLVNSRKTSSGQPPSRLRWAALGALLTLLAAAGAALAITLRGLPAPTAAPIRTVTAAPAPARTITVSAPASTQTVTAPPPSSSRPTPTGADLGQQLLGAIQAGNYIAALRLLQQAVQMQQGSGSPGEATPDNNLAYTIAQLGSCKAMLRLLERAPTSLGDQAAIDQARAICISPPGHWSGHGKGNGND